MIRKTLTTLAMTALVLVVAPSSFARGRAARPTLVSLNGRIVEAGTGAAGFSVQVSVQNQTVTSGPDGSYEVTNLKPGAATVTFERFGYVSVTKSVNLLPGFNGLNLTVQPKSVITVTDLNGVQHLMDYESTDFASLFPFTSPEILPTIEFCRSDGTTFQVAKSDLKTVTGPGGIVNGTACCPGSPSTPSIQISFETKSGTSTTGIISACKYYNVIFQGLNRQTGRGESFELTKITRIVFP